MHCPFCASGDTKVIDSRPSEDGREIKRRRECPACGKRFNTYERVEHDFPFIVKKDGSRQPYKREKIINGLFKACEKRPVGARQLEKIADAIEVKLVESGEREVTAKAIGEMIMNELIKIDHVAYVRFASVYKEFEEVGDFAAAVEEVVKNLRTKREKTKAPILTEDN